MNGIVTRPSVLALVLLCTSWCGLRVAHSSSESASTSLRRQQQQQPTPPQQGYQRHQQQERRQLQPGYFFSTSSTTVLGAANNRAASGNPLKGLYTSPLWTNGFNAGNPIQDSIDFYFVGLDEVMKGPNDFNWTYLDDTIALAAANDKHVAWRVVCHYPGEPLRVPTYLINGGLPLVNTSHGKSPDYRHVPLLNALEQFIAAFGKKYDGNKHIAFIQLGLLGKWGEFHLFPDNDLKLLNDTIRQIVVEWYRAAFSVTKLSLRFPTGPGIKHSGFHDDSFAYQTLAGSGAASKFEDFFWPLVQKSGYDNFARTNMMVGITRPELQSSVFKVGYPATTGIEDYKQSFTDCVQTTRATAIMHHQNVFDVGISGKELDNAQDAHALLGYNFQVTNVAAFNTGGGLINVDVTVIQTGVAPFYYPLNLVLRCVGMADKVLGGVHELKDAGQGRLFRFIGVPAVKSCLDKITVLLKSPHVVSSSKEIKFAQGSSGVVSFTVPIPSPTAPTSQDVKAPVSAPVKAPLFAPAAPPVKPSGDKRPCFLRRVFNRLFGWL